MKAIQALLFSNSLSQVTSKTLAVFLQHVRPMATAQVQQVSAAAVHDINGLKEEENHDQVVQDMPCAEVEQVHPHAKAHSNGGNSKEEERKVDEGAIAIDADEGQGIAKEVEAKLAVQHHHQCPAEAVVKEPKEERPREAKKAEKAAAKGAVVPVDDDETDDEVAAPPSGAKNTEKAAAKGAVVPVDDETDDEVAALAEAPVAAEEAGAEAAAGEEAAKGEQVLQDYKESAGEKQAHEE